MDMNWLQRLFYGRYGSDLLNVTLMGFSIALWVILRVVAAATHLPWLPVFSYLPFLFSIYRMFSKNLSRRSAENQAFLAGCRKVKGFFTGKRPGSPGNPYYGAYQHQPHAHSAAGHSGVKKDKNYKYYRCPGCGLHLRVPKGKGKICITCPKCRHEFIKKT